MMKRIYYVNIGDRFKLPELPSDTRYVRAPNDKLVRRIQRKQILANRSPFGRDLTKFRRELGELMAKPSKHPWQKRAEKRRRRAAHNVVMGAPVIINSELPKVPTQLDLLVVQHATS